MLVTLMALVAVLVSEGSQWLATASPANAGLTDTPIYKPEDPSTLTLAMIGLGTLVVYFATRRSNRGRRPAMSSGAESFNSRFAEVVGTQTSGPEEQPSRGAA